jgi:hypothetical protein
MTGGAQSQAFAAALATAFKTQGLGAVGQVLASAQAAAMAQGTGATFAQALVCTSGLGACDVA